MELSGDYIEYALDSMLLKAFRVVTRGVRFLDAWNEEIGLSRTIAALDGPPVPIADEAGPDPGSISSSYDDQSNRSITSLQRTESGATETVHGGSQRSQRRSSRPVSVQTKRVSASHRISSSAQPGVARNPNLASERLNAAYDSFLSVLGSFIGLHMHPRSSVELAATTHLSVRSCRTLLIVVHAVCDRGLQHHSDSLTEAKKSMFDRLTVLVEATGEAFQPTNAAEDDIAFAPNTGKRLVTAATDCVRSAGNCLAKARQALERVGDFEMDPIPPLDETENDELLTAAAASVVPPPPSVSGGSKLASELDRPLPPLPLEAGDKIPTPVEEMEDNREEQDQGEEQEQEQEQGHEQEQEREQEQEQEQEEEQREEQREEQVQEQEPEQVQEQEPEQVQVQGQEQDQEPEQVQELEQEQGQEQAQEQEEEQEQEQVLEHEQGTDNDKNNNQEEDVTVEKSFDSQESPVDEREGNIDGEQQPYQTASTGSADTDDDSAMQDSKMGGTSPPSTRATTPDPTADNNNRQQVHELKTSVSHSTLDEEDRETEAHVLQRTYAHELIWRDGNVVGGSLRALVEKLTAHDSTPDAMFVSAFYLTFRLFATPLEFAQELVERFDYIGETPHAAGAVRLRVSNVFKNWLESNWRHNCDCGALDFIADFADSKLKYHLPTVSRHLTELVAKVAVAKNPIVPRLVSSIGRSSTAGAQFVHPETPLPPTNFGKREANLLRLWKNGDAKPCILDFDALEVARQFTVKASRIFCSILPEELLASEWMKKNNSLAVNVRAMSTLSTDLAHFVADTILELEEPKRRAATVKQWIKISSRCLELNNYDTLMAIICSLNSSTIARLKRTWELVPQRHKTTLDYLRGIVDVSRNYAVLRQRLNNHVPPCLPFVGTYLTDLTFVDHGNQAVRNLCQSDGQMQVINFDKYMKTAKVIGEFQRFQIPYRLAEVPGLQTWLQDELVRVRSGSEMQMFYRRSLVLEPREPPQPPPAETTPRILESASQRFDFLSWTHPKTKLSVLSHG